MTSTCLHRREAAPWQISLHKWSGSYPEGFVRGDVDGSVRSRTKEDPQMAKGVAPAPDIRKPKSGGIPVPQSSVMEDIEEWLSTDVKGDELEEGVTSEGACQSGGKDPQPALPSSGGAHTAPRTCLAKGSRTGRRTPSSLCNGPSHPPPPPRTEGGVSSSAAFSLMLPYVNQQRDRVLLEKVIPLQGQIAASSLPASLRAPPLF
ncbi:hypothetical protein E2320_012277 [Naja naja]|nr:hypothetical protein E2320_012277 [Naja naja]